jgi:hypothetical protein
MAEDIVALKDGDPQPGESLIQPFIRSGKGLHSSQSLWHGNTSDQTLANYQRLPAAMTALDSVPGYLVTISSALKNGVSVE